MDAAAAAERAAGRTPYVIPLGASTPLGAAAFVHAATELFEQIAPPDVIIHSTSSGGTQAGLVAGCALAGVRTRVIGISADEPAASLSADVRRILDGLVDLIGPGGPHARALADAEIEIDDRFVGDGYGVPTPESREAIELVARTEALFLDPDLYGQGDGRTDRPRQKQRCFQETETVLFWHTGGQVGIFA